MIEAIDRLLSSGESLVLARIIRQRGSAPRSVGSAMLVRPDGALKGTIGGGRLEYEVLQKAAAVRASGRAALLRFELTGKDAAETEMLCGGSVEVFLEPLDAADGGVREIFREAAAAVEAGRRVVLVTAVREGAERLGRALLSPDGALAAGGLAPEEAPGFDPQSVQGLRCGTLIQTQPAGGAGALLYLEPIAGEPVLYLFGAGHVSRSVAAVARRVGFRVWVIDDRAEFANPERFPEAERILVAPIAEAFRQIRVTPAAYIVIVTRGHIHDHQALREALRTSPAYIGMIGSRRKRDIIYRALAQEGVPPEMLARVRSPIGLPIGAETPEEIAVSIVAELIQVRSAVAAACGAAGRGLPG